jgi:hypothetical protein
VDETRVQKSQLGTKNQDSIVGIGIKDTPTWTKNEEDPISTIFSTIGSRIKLKKTQLVPKSPW